MSILKYFAEVKSEEPKPVIPTTSVVSVPAPASSGYIPLGTTQPSQIVTVTSTTQQVKPNNFQDTLITALNQKAWIGFHYLAFRSSVLQLKNFIPDESQRYNAAYNTAAAAFPNISITNLLSTADECLSALDLEHSKFNQEVQKHVAEQIDAKKTDVQKLDQLIEHWTAQIQQLHVQIEQAQSDRAKFTGEASESQQKIEDTKASFESSFSTLKANIESDKQKITDYLLGTATTN